MSKNEILRTIMSKLEHVSRSEITQNLISAAVRHHINDPLNTTQIDQSTIDDIVDELYKHFEVIAWEPRQISVSSDLHKPWLTPDRIKTIKWTHFDKYFRTLVEKLGFNAASMIKRNVYLILESCGDPNDEPGKTWDIKGLAVGDIQSGKTANYIGLCAAAIDCGYRAVVILTGIHESLRAQTQARLNDSIPGVDCLTSSEDDFSIPAGVQLNLSNSAKVFVVKKNGPILRKLHEWLWANAEPNGRENQSVKQKVSSFPILLIDDEADQASLDVNVTLDENNVQEGQPSPTNALIRGILGLFERSSYVAYTATPQANILVSNLLEDENHVVLTEGEAREIKDLKKRIASLSDSSDANDSLDNGKLNAIEDMKKRVESIGTLVFLGKDLYPRHFMKPLETPPSYYGAEKYFGSRLDDESVFSLKIPVIRYVDDAGGASGNEKNETVFPIGHDKDYDPGRLPESLKKAILEFLLLAAAKNIRLSDSEKINSMLIHVTRFQHVQSKVKRLVYEFLEKVSNDIFSMNPAETYSYQKFVELYHGVINTNSGAFPFASVSVAVQDVFPHQYNRIVPELDSLISEVKNLMVRAPGRQGLHLIELNGATNDALVYRGKTNYTVICIGGDRLSRGLTLDDLIVSYYLRSSANYDTLFQMGRWFGYRHDYVDLTRIYTTRELAINFAHVSAATNDIRQQMFDMIAEGQTPEDIAVKIITHDRMLVTNRQKQRFATRHSVDFSLASKETTKFRQETLDKNFGVVIDFSRNLEWSVENGRRVSRGRLGDRIVDFLQKYDYRDRDGSEGDLKLLAKYIERKLEINELIDWQIFFHSNSVAELPDKLEPISILYPDIKVVFGGDTRFPLLRSCISQADGIALIKAVGGSNDEAICLTPEQMERAREETARIRDNRLPISERRGTQVLPYTGSPLPIACRKVRDATHGVLHFYPVALCARPDDDDDKRLLEDWKYAIGFRLSFPKSRVSGGIGAIGLPIESEDD